MIGYAMEVSRWSRSPSACQFGPIRNTHDSVPTPIAIIIESMKLAQSRPGLRRRISSSSPSARHGYTRR